MERLLTIALLLIIGFNVGLLMIRVFGAPGTEDRPEDACVRLRRQTPSR